jgi:hypothetical protein
MPHECLAQPLAFEQHPVVVALRQQVALVSCRRLLECTPQQVVVASTLCRRGLGKGAFDLRDIEREAGIRAPLYDPRIDVQEAVGIGQGVAQAVQQRAQIGVRLGFGRIWPELKSEMGTSMRRSAMQQEIRQQRLQPWRVEGRDGRIVSGEAEAAQQLDVQGHGVPPCGRGTRPPPRRGPTAAVRRIRARPARG